MDKMLVHMIAMNETQQTSMVSKVKYSMPILFKVNNLFGIYFVLVTLFY